MQGYITSGIVGVNYESPRVAIQSVLKNSLDSDVEQEVDSKSSFFVAMGKGIISWFRGHLEAKALEGTGKQPCRHQISYR